MARNEFELRVGPFSFFVDTNCQIVSDNVKATYGDFETTSLQEEFIDFYISVNRPRTIRRWYKPKVNFYFDGFSPFKPLPEAQAYAMLEWGMNWCIANHAHQFLILHAAAIERKDKVIIMPAPPGSGKSTLCAAMAFTDWRLFSDELALFSITDHQVYPCTRPINLKNDSINILRDYVKDAVFSDTAEDTQKGTVALLKPPLASVETMHVPAHPGAIIFPQYKKGSPAELIPMTQLEAFSQIIENCFNYHTLGLTGFRAIEALLNKTSCYSLSYSQFEEANELLTKAVS